MKVTPLAIPDVIQLEPQAFEHLYKTTAHYAPDFERGI